jgi:cell wall-associated NlpC family hydrolase
VDEAIMRQRIAEEAISWIGTPYVSNAMVKGKAGGGTDCAMLLIAVYGELELIPKAFDPRPYPPQWHLHRNEEKYMEFVCRFATEVKAPPERMPKIGDVVMFKIGRLFAHGGIIVNWPNVVHAIGNNVVMMEDISRNTIGKRALAVVPKKFFTLKGWN